MTYTTPTDTG